ncbi:hypothetical protein FHR75_001276 [Kineococcus radiotolerans]|uniref:HNH endonuclease n=1 Tax=Kineococcus radiotolerans TaxID=131568 RepID=A0A7W4TKB8_KINRA|nr:hypothetical protein [Kineococcus radiotolerans]MBB2900488.1 hypothetical protein [Kineococcus radiotolerans]
MRQVILQPAGNAGARQHYADTIAAPVLLDDYSDLLGEDLASLLAIYPSGAAPLWGATVGEKNVNVGRYERMSVGDYVLFAADGKIFRGGTVTYKLRNAQLAAKLWDFDAKGRTWELMFAVDELRNFDLPYAEFNKMVGYKSTNIVQGFAVLDEPKSAALFDQLSLDSDTYPAVPSSGDLQKRLTALGDETERQVAAAQRLEQGLLRHWLLPDASGVCALCGRDFPAQLLIAAHIKKRAACTNQERMNMPAIAMLACKLGCDSLFEAGHISVDANGSVIVSSLAHEPGAAGEYLKSFAGKSSPAWNADRATYFEWHRKHTFKGSSIPKAS